MSTIVVIKLSVTSRKYFLVFNIYDKVNYKVLFLGQGLNGFYDKVNYKVVFLGQGLNDFYDNVNYKVLFLGQGVNGF